MCVTHVSFINAHKRSSCWNKLNRHASDLFTCARYKSFATQKTFSYINVTNVILIIDSPACLFGFINENEFHFFLVCPLYNIPRLTLQNAMGHIAPFTLTTLLYGDEN